MRILITLVFAGLLASCGGNVKKDIHPASQVELFGFQIGQVDDVARHLLGRPFKAASMGDGWYFEAFALTKFDRPDNYVVFKYPPGEFPRVYSVQIAGPAYPDMPEFHGVTLGMTEADVLKRFGKPDKIEKINDKSSQGTFWIYQHKNYSFEFTPAHQLSSIQIYGYDGFSNNPDIAGVMNQYEKLKKAILSGNDEALITKYLSPDVEFYHKQDVVRYQLPPRYDFSKSSSAIREYVYKRNNSLKAFFKNESDTRSNLDMRIMAGVGTFPVLKFPDSHILYEIVFTFHAGEWKVFEVAFKDEAPI